MRTKNTVIQITEPSNEAPISGIVTTALPYGSLVTYKNSLEPQDVRELVLADKKAGFVLMQDVVSLADWQAQVLQEEHFPSRVHSKVPLGQAVTARPWRRLELEGTTFLGASITGATNVETKLALLAGKFEVWVDNATSGEVVGIVDRIITPVTAGNVRLSIRQFSAL
jgi:hypothetical protein